MQHTEQFLAGGGEMGKLIQSMDWSTTPLGPIASWPQSLKTTVSLCLSSTFPILIAWGPETIQIYNDSYRPICGDKHPASMGQNFRICWETALPVVGDAFTRGQEGEGTYIMDQRMFLDRNGYLEEAFMTFSFAPIRNEAGEVGGIFHPITETTDKMLSARRTHVIRDVSAQIGKAKTVKNICAATLEKAADFSLDIPFLLLYQLGSNGDHAHLIAHTGIPAQTALTPETVALRDTAAWPFERVLQSMQYEVVTDLNERFGEVPAGPYPEMPHSAILLPVHISGQPLPWGFIVAGVSSRRALDEPYLNFYELLGHAFSTAFSNVHAYEQEQQRAEALAAIDKAKTAFFSNVSHEFRTPLTLMIGPLEELLQQPLLQDKLYKNNLDATYRNTHRLLKLVNNLLDFSRVEADRLKAVYQPVDLAMLTTDLASSFQSIIEKAGMQLIVKCITTQPVYVDVEIWEKIVLNLLSNAFKFTLKGSISVQLYETDTHAILQVADTGVGIPEKELPHMFERFHRVENSFGRTHEGSGIGLSLVNELVRLHAGTISVESTAGQGSTFTIALPFGHTHIPPEQLAEAGKLTDTTILKGAFLQEANSLLDEDVSSHEGHYLPEMAQWEISDNADDSERAQVLIVDDNADMRNYLSRLLEKNFDITVAKNGLDALQQLEHSKPDLILSDVMMPVMNGKALLENVRNNPATTRIPLIFLSARAGGEARIDGLEAGADDYLVKPFSAKELLTKVKAHIKILKLRNQVEQQLEQHVQDRTGELKIANEELKRTNQELEDFVFISSHDLQEPLRKIQTFGNIAMSADAAGMPVREYLEKMIASASRMSGLIKDLLSYTRLNKSEDPFVTTDLNEIMQQVLSDLEIVIQERNAQIEIPLLPLLKAVPVQINQLFHNLLSNALKFSDKDPVIRVSVALLSPEKQKTLTALEPGKRFYELGFHDNGIGFEQKYADQVFTIFKRLVKATQYPGTGIGLTICRKVTLNHGGNIYPVSAPGKGTAFYVYLPVS